MRKLLVTLDDEISPLLAKYPNQGEVVRQALHLYIGDITTESMKAIAATYRLIDKRLTEIEAKLDYIKPVETFQEPILVLDSQDPDDAPRDLGEVIRELKSS